MKTVIFDFDGTIADTFVTSIRIFERMTKRAVPFNNEEIERLRGMHALELIRTLKIRPWRMPWLLIRGRALMRREIEEILIFAKIEGVFAELHAAGVPMYIMSSNSTVNIQRFLKRHQLDHYFQQIYGNVSILGKTKMLRRILERNRLDPATTAYVGDESRDVEAAKRVGMQSVAVSWGYNNAELLKSHEPAFLVDSVAELAKILRA